MRQTANYHLLKPDYSDPADVKDLNDNMDLIDSALVLKANLVGGKVPASELPSYVDDVIEGYYYNGAFYQDSGHTIAISGETGKIYIDKSTESCYRWSGSVYVQISSPESPIVEGYYYNGAFYEESAHTTLITGETGKLYIDLSTENCYRWNGAAYVQISSSESPILWVEFTEDNTVWDCDTDLPEMFDALDAGQEVIGKYSGAPSVLFFVGNWDDGFGDSITFFGYNELGKIAELFGTGSGSPSWSYDEFSLRGGGGGELPVATNSGDIPSWNAGTQLWTITPKGTIAQSNQGYVTGGDVYTAIGNIPQIPVGTNTGDILVWNGSAWVAKAPSRLPSAYQEVEYIESTGTQYLQLDFSPTNNLISELDVEASNWTASGAGVFGARTANGSQMYELLALASNLRMDYGNSGDVDRYYSFTLSSGRHNIKMLKNVLYVDGTALNTFPSDTINTPYNMCVFSANQGGTPNPVFPMKLRSAKFFNNGIPVAKLVPCYRKSDSEIGVYDLVSDNFYTNAGTGTFTKGADVN